MKRFFLFIIPILATLTVIVSCTREQVPMLVKSWGFYKTKFISEDGRVIDPWQNNITTSEGQSYAMLRAVLINDRETFDLVYKWSLDNLKRDNDRLFAWLWGQREDKTWGIIDKNSASDADIDIAFALILAFKQWDDKQYLKDAKDIIKDIWEQETIDIKKQRVLVSGVEQMKADKLEINPSYFAPYAFRVFDKYDKAHDWDKIVDSSYDLLNKVTKLTDTGLPPNWFFLDSKTGEISLAEGDSTRNDFSYDAIRTFLRVYLDYEYKKDKRALKIIEKTKFFPEKYPLPEKAKGYYLNFKANGKLRDKNEHIGAIAVLVPIFGVYDKEYAKKLYTKKVESNYNAEGFWGEKTNYYAQNLAWIGTWLYLNDKE